MVYTPREWQDGELITKDSLNRIETGIGGVQPIGINVSKYGAVGDGVTDDTQAIQTAINSNIGSVILLEPGKTYAVSSTIQITGKTSFDGGMAVVLLTQNTDYVFDIETASSYFKNVWIKKSSGVISNGIKISGNANFIDNIQSRNMAWPKFIHGVSMNESHLSHIRVDNMPGDITGNIIELDYCVNNTLSNSFIGYADKGVYLSDVKAADGYYNEGLMISDTTIIKCNTAVHARHATSVNITNSILDFCANYGVKLHAGQAFFMSNTWVALVNDYGIGVGVEDNAVSEFREIIVSNNEIVGIVGNNNQQAFNLTTLNINVSITNNIMQSIKGGRVGAKKGNRSGNITPGYSAITGYQKPTHKVWYTTTNAQYALAGVNNAVVKLVATQTGTKNILVAFGSVDSAGQINLTATNSSGITLGTINSTVGSVGVVPSDGVNTNLMILIETYPYDAMSEI